MWDLNSWVYKEIPYLTIDFIRSKVSDSQIFSYYIGRDVRLGETIHSPLRKDKVPSFSLFRAYSGTILYKDFATRNVGGAIKFVMDLKGISYREALYKIACDFNIIKDSWNLENRVKDSNYVIKERKIVELGIKKRPWRKIDRLYWSSYGVKKSTLERFWVSPISFVFFNGHPVKVDEHAYAYREFKEGSITYEIYQPYNKKYKWIQNADSTVHQGYRQLPERGEILIITKSRKDVMSIYDVVGIPAVGLQSEGVMMKASVMEEYKSRFKNVVNLFDNDRKGREFSLKFSKEYNIPEIFMPKGAKDFSDTVKQLGPKETSKILRELLTNKMYN